MQPNPKNVEHHEHGGSQCKPSDAGTVCKEGACKHDHHISSHVEVSCTPIAGQRDRYDCVHEKR